MKARHAVLFATVLFAFGCKSDWSPTAVQGDPEYRVEKVNRDQVESARPEPLEEPYSKSDR